jgi:hypothetical protein
LIHGTTNIDGNPTSTTGIAPARAASRNATLLTVPKRRIWSPATTTSCDQEFRTRPGS